MKLEDINLAIKDLDPEKDYNVSIADGKLKVEDAVSSSASSIDNANDEGELEMAKKLIEKQNDQIKELKEANRTILLHGTSEKVQDAKTVLAEMMGIKKKENK